MRKTIAAIATAAIVLGGFAVALFVQSPEAAVAQEVEQLENTSPGPIEEVLAELVEEGVITEEQAAEVGAALRERIGEFRSHKMRLARGMTTAAEVIGIETDELAEALRAGETIGGVAEANGSSAQAVIDALIAEANEKLDQAVEDGKLTAERAEEIRADAPERIEALVNGEFEGRRGFGGPGGRHFGPGPDAGPDPESTNA